MTARQTCKRLLMPKSNARMNPLQALHAFIVVVQACQTLIALQACEASVVAPACQSNTDCLSSLPSDSLLVKLVGKQP